MGSVNTHFGTMTKTTAAIVVFLVGGFALGRASAPANPFTPEETQAAKVLLRQERLLQKLREKLVEELAPLGVTVK